MDLTFDQKVALFRQTATSQQARADFAASRANVINPELEVQSTVRFIFSPEKLAPGATPTYDIPFEDVECTYMMPQIGGIPTVQVEGKQMSIDTFGLDGGVEYQIDVAKDGRFQVAQLATTMLRNKFIAQEELAGWNLIKLHAAALPSTQKVIARKDDGTVGAGNGTDGKLNVHTISEMITTADEIGVGGRRVTDIYVSPRRFGDLRSAISMTALPESLRSQIWGNGKGVDSLAEVRIHRVYNRNLVSNAKGYAFTQKDGVTYGKMPIREELSTRDNPIAILEWKIGIIGRMRVGFGVLDDKGLVEVAF
jgi:hypothetical protein